MASKVGGVNCHLLVDTEAQVSIISHTFWLKNKPGGAQLTGYNDKVSVANGGHMEIFGRWQTVCEFDNLALITDFLVANCEGIF